MSKQCNATPDNPLIKSYLNIFGVLGIVVAVLLVAIVFGKYRNSNMTDMDIATNTRNLGQLNDCYFDNVVFRRNSNGEITSLEVRDQDYKLDIVPFTDPETKKVIAYKLSREQMMYCTQGRFNYKTAFIVPSRVLSELPPKIAATKAKAFEKDKAYKRVAKLGNYIMD